MLFEFLLKWFSADSLFNRGDDKEDAAGGGFTLIDVFKLERSTLTINLVTDVFRFYAPLIKGGDLFGYIWLKVLKMELQFVEEATKNPELKDLMEIVHDKVKGILEFLKEEGLLKDLPVADENAVESEQDSKARELWSKTDQCV